MLHCVTFFRQIGKIKLCHEETFQILGLLTMGINAKNQLLARVAMDGRFHLRVMNRYGGQMSSDILSKCDHPSACIATHPTKAGLVFEGCYLCEVIRCYDIHTTGCKIVHTGSRPMRMCRGPPGSILVQCRNFPVFESSRTGLSEFKWDEEQQELHSDKSVYLQGRPIQACYTERFDILAVMYENGEVEAVKFGNNSQIWKLPKEVGGHVINQTP